MPNDVGHPVPPRLRPGPASLALLALAALGLVVSAGCARELRDTLAPNQRPTVRLTYAPVDTTQREFYVYRMYWTGFDADGRVVRFEYAVDPPGDAGADTAWIATARNSEAITFSATQPESLRSGQPLSRDFHVFVIRAVDNRGSRSEPVARAFYSYCVAPAVSIDSPPASRFLSPAVPPSVLIHWTGMDFTDASGAAYTSPLYYKYKLFTYASEPRLAYWLSHPDSMRATFAPDFAGWDSTGPDSNHVYYTGLVPGSEYLFVVVAFGRSGAYSPVWSLDTNMLHMWCGYWEPVGPRITLYRPLTFTYPDGGMPLPLDSTSVPRLQVPASEPLFFSWGAEPSVAGPVFGCRWVMDPASLDDETPRSGPGDVSHWSDWSLETNSAMVGPFTGSPGGEVHDFFIQAKDVMGYVSLAWLQFAAFAITRERELLVVNDTRFAVDQLSRTQPPGRTDSLAAPTGVWPTRAELDTFLFAVGGMPWRMTPPGTLSPVGIFHGYDFDTLGTRYGVEDPIIPLDVLGRYRHIVWMTDAAGSRLEGSPVSATLPITTLRYMSTSTRPNTLAAYVQQGGQLWALGGGFGNATNAPWNVTANDLNGVRTYSSLGTVSLPDLGPGRFLYDLAHWRSEFRVFNGFIRFARYDQPDPTSIAPGAWPGLPFRDPRYAALPTRLLPRSPATDPLWPYRTAQYYYVNNPAYSTIGINLEYLTYRNNIWEMVQVTPDSSHVHVALDTLYLAYGPAYTKQLLQAGEGVNGLMTYYHGSDNGSVMFLGTSVWDHQRAHCQALVDVVLGSMWGLSKNAAVTAPQRQVASRR
jgi:hypothetical protein